MQEFPFSAPAQVQTFSYVILGVVAIAGIAGIAFDRSKAKRILTAIIIIPALFFLARSLLPAAAGAKVTLGETLTVISGHSKIEIAKSDVISATVIDYKTDPNLHPTIRTMGTAIGDYRTGWFVLANGKKAFMMTATTQVVAFELPDKYVLVAPKDFDQFVKAVNDGFVPVK